MVQMHSLALYCLIIASDGNSATITYEMYREEQLLNVSERQKYTETMHRNCKRMMIICQHKAETPNNEISK